MRRRGYQLTRYADDWAVTCRSMHRGARRGFTMIHPDARIRLSSRNPPTGTPLEWMLAYLPFEKLARERAGLIDVGAVNVPRRRPWTWSVEGSNRSQGNETRRRARSRRSVPVESERGERSPFE